MKSVYASLSILALALTAVAANQLYFKTQSTAEIAIFTTPEGNTIVQQRTPNFELVRKYDMNSGVVLLALIESVVTHSQILQAEGMDGDVSVRVRGGDKFKNVIWERKEKATAVSYQEEIGAVVTSLGGCCGSMTSHRAFDVTSGKLMISYSEAIPYGNQFVLPYLVEIPNSSLSIRMIGIITPDATRDVDFVTPTAGMQAAALLKYASRGGAFQKVQVDMIVKEGYGISVQSEMIVHGATGPQKPEIREGKATLWNADKATNPAAITGVAMKLTLSAGHNDLIVLIPIHGDRFDVSRAQVPAGATVRIVK